MTRLLTPVLAAVLVATGCNSHPDVRKTYPVTGTLTVNGAPGEAGVIVFLTPQFTETDKHPIHPRALTGAGGTFKFTTYNSDDGVPEGEYVATLEWPPPTGAMSSYASGDMFGGAFAKPELTAGLPGFNFTVTKNGATVNLQLTLTQPQLQALEAAKKKAADRAKGIQLNRD